jgi:Fic family protein
MDLLSIQGTPYYLPGDGAQQFSLVVRTLSERVEGLRASGKLTEATLRRYHGEKRFEQVAESNALEGNTLSVGETELAVVKGITITGHDPGFSRDARSLAKALDELVEMARSDTPTNIEQVKRIHEIVLEGRSSAGEFRRDEVRIRGSLHRPPRSWKEVIEQMEDWERWSAQNPGSPPILRASVLHAWLEHIHPFNDGNGRTGRAITNLELIRAGYPPIIIRKNKDRDRYLDALRRADEGELGGFLEIIAGRLEDSLRDLERAASHEQGYDAFRQRLHIAQSNRLSVWDAGVHLLFVNIQSHLSEFFSDRSVDIDANEFQQLSVEDFIDLCEGRPVRLSWAFRLGLHVPGMPTVERLAWTSFQGSALTAYLGREHARPVLKWSIPNPAGYPRWIEAGADSPGGEEMTIHRDRWLVVRDSRVTEETPSDLAARIARQLAETTIPSSGF